MYCGYCGHKNIDGMKFCEKCGKELAVKTHSGKRRIVCILALVVSVACIFAVVYLKLRKKDYDYVSTYNNFGLARAELEGKYGYIDEKEKEVIPVKYDDVGEFDESGLSIVEKDRKFGLYAYTGEEIFPIDYNYIEIMSQNENDLIPVKVNDSILFLNADYERAFGEIKGANIEGYYIVTKDNKYGCVDEKGNYFLECKYESIDLTGVYDQKVKAVLDGRFNYVSLSGKILYDSVDEERKNGLYLVKKGTKYGYINDQGEEIIPCIYSTVSIGEKQANGYIPINLDGKKNFMDQSGKMIYKSVGEYSENGLAAACDEYDFYGYVDMQGDPVTEFYYLEAGDFGSHSLARVRADDIGGSWGYINKLGTTIVKIKYDEAWDFNDFGYAMVKFGEMYNFISEMGTEMFEYVGEFKDGIAIAKSDQKYGLVDEDGNLVTDVWYDLIYDEKEFRDCQLFRARKGGDYVLLDIDGQELSDECDGIGEPVQDTIVFWKNGKYGLMDIKGNVLADPQYNYIENRDDLLRVVFETVKKV